MKLEEFIKLSFPDLYVGNDYSDEWYDSYGEPFLALIAFCSPIHFTDEGKKKFKSIMKFEVKTDGNSYATVKIPGKTDAVKQRNLNKVMLMFYATAGYISDTTYKRWFKED